MIEQAAVTSKGIQELLKSYGWEEAFSEYIWNGFDAGASKIQIVFDYDSELMDAVNALSIIDNGSGFSKAELSKKFKPIYESEKAVNSGQPKNHSLPHGRNGKGRLTFFTFAKCAKWEIHYLEKDKTFSHGVSIDANMLDRYSSYELPTTQVQTGTKVNFTGVFDVTKTKIETSLIPFLRKEFAWFLELNKASNFVIEINEAPLDYEQTIIERENFTINEHSTDRFDICFVLWSEKKNEEYSKYYFLNSGGKEVWKHNTTLNNKGDNFYHSVYIQSGLFDNFQWAGDAEIANQDDLFVTQKSEKFKELLSKLSDYLYRKRNPFINVFTEKLVSEYEKEGVFPVHGNSPIDRYHKEALKDTVKELYKVQPKIFSSLNNTQKKAFIGLLDALLELGADDRLLEIISKIVDMTPSERSELAHILEYASMSAITKTIGLIKDRMKTISQLKQLVNDETWGAEEVDIQKIIESHYWIFGEQFNLTTAEEPDFEEALRRYTYLLQGDGHTRKPKIIHSDKNKEMDIFITRKIVSHDRIENIVVELKHPLVSLGKKELNQVETYLQVITKVPTFTADNMHWKFILVGKKFDTSDAIPMEYENAKNHGERYLVKKYASIRCSVYVMTWSDIFLEFECKHNHLLNKLELNKAKMMEDLKRNKDAAEVVADATQNVAVETATWESPAIPICLDAEDSAVIAITRSPERSPA